MLLEIFLEVFLFLFGAAVLIYLYFQYNYTHWKKKGVPFIQPIFPFGSAKDLYEEKLSLGEFGAKMYKDLKEKTSSFGGFYIFHSRSFVPIDPELVKCVLSKDFNVFQDRGTYCDEDVDPLSGNLVNLSGQKWKKLRAKVSPVFTSGKIKMMLHILQNCSVEMVKVLEEQYVGGQPLDILDLTSRLTTDNIGNKKLVKWLVLANHTFDSSLKKLF